MFWENVTRASWTTYMFKELLLQYCYIANKRKPYQLTSYISTTRNEHRYDILYSPINNYTDLSR